jgi:hypothetical protein
MCVESQKLGLPENIHFHMGCNENKILGLGIKILYNPQLKVITTDLRLLGLLSGFYGFGGQKSDVLHR